MNIESINPATGEVLTSYKEDSADEIKKKYTRALDAFAAWNNVPLKERVACIKKFSEILGNKIEGFAKVLTDETGKPLQQSVNEINGAITRIRFFYENAEKWLQEEEIHRSGNMVEKIQYEPLGVIGNISAWNYPYLVGVNVFVPALLAGNMVLYKPSEYTIGTGLKIGEALAEAGIPGGAFQVVVGKGTAGAVLTDLPLDGYFFTGSFRTGSMIYEKVAKKMVPCQMELGGKDPLYVMKENKNISAVAEAAVEGAFYNNGQSCCAVERIYVHEAVYDDFIKDFKIHTDNLVVGAPNDKNTFFGPLARKEQVDFLSRQVQDAVGKGAKVLNGGGSIVGKGYYFQPTVLIDVDHTMEIMMEESFGPVIGIQKVKGDEEAVQKMLDTEYGLTAAIYSDDMGAAEPIMKKMNTGTVYWNCCDRVSPNLPWSGRKHSGIGATLSYLGIRAFVKPKALHLRFPA